MSISYPASVPQTVGPDVPVTTTASIASVTILPANPARSLEGYIINNSPKNMWVAFNGLAATTASPSTKIPANGGSMDVPGGYTGAITGIWEAGATLNCTVHEFSYV